MRINDSNTKTASLRASATHGLFAVDEIYSFCVTSKVLALKRNEAMLLGDSVRLSRKNLEGF